MAGRKLGIHAEHRRQLKALRTKCTDEYRRLISVGRVPDMAALAKKYGGVSAQAVGTWVKQMGLPPIREARAMAEQKANQRAAERRLAARLEAEAATRDAIQ